MDHNTCKQALEEIHNNIEKLIAGRVQEKLDQLKIMNQTWLPFDPSTCPQDIPIIIYGENVFGVMEMALVTYHLDTYPLGTYPRFSAHGVSGYDTEDTFDSYHLPSHYMLAPQPPKAS